MLTDLFKERWSLKKINFEELETRLNALINFSLSNNFENLKVRILNETQYFHLKSSIAELNFCYDLIKKFDNKIVKIEYERSREGTSTTPDVYMVLDGESHEFWFQVKLPGKGEAQGKQASFIRELEKELQNIKLSLFYSLNVNSSSYKMDINKIRKEVRHNLDNKNYSFTIKDNECSCYFEFTPPSTLVFKELTLGCITENNTAEGLPISQDIKNAIDKAVANLDSRGNYATFVVLDISSTSAHDSEILEGIYGSEYFILHPKIFRGRNKNGAVHLPNFSKKISAVILRVREDNDDLFSKYCEIVCLIFNTKLLPIIQECYPNRINSDYETHNLLEEFKKNK